MHLLLLYLSDRITSIAYCKITPLLSLRLLVTCVPHFNYVHVESEQNTHSVANGSRSLCMLKLVSRHLKGCSIIDHLPYGQSQSHKT